MAKKNKSGFFTDFKKFITKGNILDMAVGMIIGTAFNQIVKSLVDHILMPVIGNLCNTQDLVDLKYILTPEVLDEAGNVVTAEVAISYGLFLLSEEVEYELSDHCGSNAYEYYCESLEPEQYHTCDACRCERDKNVAHDRCRGCFCVYMRR